MTRAPAKRQRLRVAMLLPALLLAAAPLAYLAYSHWSRALEERQEHALAMLAALAPAGEYALLTGNTVGLSAALGSDELRRAFTGVVLLDADGSILFSKGRARHLPSAGPPAITPVIRRDGRRLSLAAPIRLTPLTLDDRLLVVDVDAPGEQVLGWLLADIDLAPLRDAGIRTLAIGLLVALGASLAALAAARCAHRS